MIKTLAMLAILAVPFSVSADSGVGRVTGRVVEGTCRTPLAYASVVVLGTSHEATTGSDGTFEIDSIPPGKYKVRAIMVGYKWGNATVVVHADSTSSLSLKVTSQVAAKGRKPRPNATKRCTVHGVDMRAVSVRIGSGDALPPSHAAETVAFPNAEPFEGKHLGLPLLGMTWGYRCPQCAQARNEHDNGGVWPLRFDAAAPAGWVRYQIANAVSFSAPAGMSATTTGNDCAATGEWVGGGMRITASYGPMSYVEQFGSGDVSGDVIIGDAYVRVALWKTGAGAKLASGFWAPPVGTSRLTLTVEVDDANRVDAAAAIVGSVKFAAQ